MRRSVRVTAVVALTTGFVVGCTSEDPPADEGTTSDGIVTDREPDNPEFSPGEEESPEPLPGEDGAANALSAAAEELGGQSFAVERNDDDGEELWEVSVAVGDDDIEVHVSVDGNEIVHEGEREPLEDEDRRRLEGASISAAEAATTAATEMSATVEEVDLNEHLGTVVWDVELLTTDGATTEVRVDATTGEVL
ncbi:Peptidase propeptide and YPEB domain-containing protein [Georgenia satyanarayanai]|uniref:Peptidase propeptide and YPEB domain-containing protein n=1 Tax=Georgenia satyanarayanai TaxID=860221 RepID=A0A2Y9AT12_9MICO|nr:PepSY domain-containing protein [Georgenia satyanarayanai]PYF97845.1 peptidase YpeB-like protein [Georgenia satyanarayanai]SSA45419.1 Peptidase propeptide and YPEB domain-containing protein [Georgenia satyanarayanai]